MTMTFGSLFSGIGGIDLGLERAGMHCEWQVEIDEYATKVLAKHWPNTPRHGDIRDCGARNLPCVDLIAGGFPCQDISGAGKRAGITGERSGLWSEFYRIICELRPRYVLVENVAALLYPIKRDGYIEPAPISRVLGDLAEGGYDAEWQILPAAAFGAPHIRERVFIVAYPASDRRDWWEHQSQSRQQECASLPGKDGNGQPLAHTHGTGCPELDVAPIADQPGYDTWRNLAPGMADATSRRERFHIFPRAQEGAQSFPFQSSWWTVESSVDRVADGVPRRVDRLRGLGNAVVPQVAEYIGRCILECEHGKAG